MPRKIVACLAASLTALPAAHAQQAMQDWQPVDAMAQTVANAMGRAAAPIDRRIKLARCPEQPTVTSLDTQTLAVRCAPLGWRLRVPLTGPAGAAPMQAGFAAPAATAPVVRRGDNVRVTIESETFTVSYSAIATQDGRLGETIALRGNDAKNMLSAVVTGPGRARMTD